MRPRPNSAIITPPPPPFHKLRGSSFYHCTQPTLAWQFLSHAQITLVGRGSWTALVPDWHGCVGMCPWCGEGSGHSSQNAEVCDGFQLLCEPILALLEEQSFAVSVSLFAQLLSRSPFWSRLSPSQHFLSSSLNLRLPPSPVSDSIFQQCAQQHGYRTASGTVKS